MRTRFEQIKRHIFTRRGQEASLRQTLKQSQDGIVSLTKTLENEVEILRLLQATSAATWQNTKRVIESVVTRGLRAIFDDKSYKFVVNQEIKRNVPTVEFLVEEDGIGRDLLDELGGGIVDVVGILLRLSFMVLVRPKQRQFLVLDEPSRHLAERYQPNLGKFLGEICKELDIQILAVTHNKDLADSSDQTFVVEKEGRSCVVTSH